MARPGRRPSTSPPIPTHVNSRPDQLTELEDLHRARQGVHHRADADDRPRILEPAGRSGGDSSAPPQADLPQPGAQGAHELPQTLGRGLIPRDRPQSCRLHGPPYASAVGRDSRGGRAGPSPRGPPTSARTAPAPCPPRAWRGRARTPRGSGRRAADGERLLALSPPARAERRAVPGAGRRPPAPHSHRGDRCAPRPGSGAPTEAAATAPRYSRRASATPPRDPRGSPPRRAADSSSARRPELRRGERRPHPDAGRNPHRGQTLGELLGLGAQIAEGDGQLLRRHAGFNLLQDVARQLIELRPGGGSAPQRDPFGKVGHGAASRLRQKEPVGQPGAGSFLRLREFLQRLGRDQRFVQRPRSAATSDPLVRRWPPSPRRERSSGTRSRLARRPQRGPGRSRSARASRSWMPRTSSPPSPPSAGGSAPPFNRSRRLGQQPRSACPAQRVHALAPGGPQERAAREVARGPSPWKPCSASCSSAAVAPPASSASKTPSAARAKAGCSTASSKTVGRRRWATSATTRRDSRGVATRRPATAAATQTSSSFGRDQTQTPSATPRSAARARRCCSTRSASGKTRSCGPERIMPAACYGPGPTFQCASGAP